MPVNVHCDHCGQALQVIEEHEGKQVRCPKCYQVFVAKVAPAAVAVPVPPDQGAAFAPSPAPPQGGARFCPHCGQSLPAVAGFCPSCGKAPAAPPDPGPGAPAFAPSFAPAPYAAPPATNGLATASLVLAIASWACLGPLAGIPAVICGHVARGQIRASAGTQTGESLALVALVIGYLNTLLWCGYIGFFGIIGASGGKFP